MILRIYLLLSFCALAFLALVRQDPFFWDTVQLASKHAHFFFQNKLHWGLLPENIDSGHPPLLGWYLAAVWTIFGKTLAASHWAMAPFVVANACLLYRLGLRFGAHPNHAIWLPLLAFADPVLLGQSALASPDIVLVTGFLLAIEGSLGYRRWMLGLGVLLLCSISMRGMMVGMALLVFETLNWIGLKRKQVPPYFAVFFLPGFLFAAWFYAWHWKAAGWIGFHANSPWAPAFEKVGPDGWLKNCLILGWRWLDFGRVFEWVAVMGIATFSWKSARTWWRHSKALPLVLVLLVFLSPSALLYHNLSAHRYFLPAFLAFHFLTVEFLTGSGLSEKIKTAVLILLLAGLATGNCWIYPRGISMDWDSTLAHRPYHILRAEMVDYLDAQKIDFAGVGSAFPNLNTGEDLLLNGDTRRFSEKDFSTNRYVLASNVFNDFSEADYALLQRDWILEKRLERSGVWLELYHRP